jgi:hypothetical protein
MVITVDMQTIFQLEFVGYVYDVSIQNFMHILEDVTK